MTEIIMFPQECNIGEAGRWLVCTEADRAVLAGLGHGRHRLSENEIERQLSALRTAVEHEIGAINAPRSRSARRGRIIYSTRAWPRSCHVTSANRAGRHRPHESKR